MTSDLDIYRTASVLIREHGDEADLLAFKMRSAHCNPLRHRMSGLGAIGLTL